MGPSIWVRDRGLVTRSRTAVAERKMLLDVCRRRDLRELTFLIHVSPLKPSGASSDFLIGLGRRLLGVEQILFSFIHAPVENFPHLVIGELAINDALGHLGRLDDGGVLGHSLGALADLTNEAGGGCIDIVASNGFVAGETWMISRAGAPSSVQFASSAMSSLTEFLGASLWGSSGGSHVYLWGLVNFEFQPGESCSPSRRSAYYANRSVPLLSARQQTVNYGS